MSKRSEHLFQFKASQITEACAREAKYHEERAAYWRDELEAATTIVEETAGVEVKKQAITGGWRPEVVVHYGDPSAYARMQEAWSKLNKHEEEAERFRTDEKVYDTQGDRTYELDTADVHYYRLGLEERVTV